MSTSHLARFLPPDRGRNATRPGVHLLRACISHVKSRVLSGDFGDPKQTARDLYGEDEATFAFIERAAVSPATTTTSGQAAELAGKATLDFVLTLPESAASKLFAAGLTIDMTGRNEVKIPRLSGALPSVTFIDEAAPAPAIQLSFADTTLPAPSKLMVLSGYTRETATSASADAVIANVLKAAAARSLDGAIFSATAASSARPAGILVGATTVTPGGGGGGGYAALVGDLEGLIGSITANGATSIALVAGPHAATALALRLPDLPFPLWPSAALDGRTLVALDPSVFATGFSPDPRIESSISASIHYEGTSPLALGIEGTPATVAAPTRSAFQTDTTVLRLILPTSWVMREPGRIAVVSNITW